MTNQTALEKIQLDHLSDISHIMIERLEYIHIKPDNIIVYTEIQNIEKQNMISLQKLYSQAEIYSSSIPPLQQADLLFAVLSSCTEDMTAVLTEWKKMLKSEGLLLFGLLNINFELRDIGDFLVYLGYKDVVMDRELFSTADEVIYGHAWVPPIVQPVSIPVSQICR